jgi:hypothetical protein
MNAPSYPPERCPLCGKGNQCAMEVERTTGRKQPPCWCTQATFDAALIDGLAPEAKGQACICAACAAASSLKTPDGRPASP